MSKFSNYKAFWSANATIFWSANTGYLYFFNLRNENKVFLYQYIHFLNLKNFKIV